MEKNSPLMVAVITALILIFPIPTSQDLIHWFMFVGVRIRVSKYDVDYGVSLDFP